MNEYFRATEHFVANGNVRNALTAAVLSENLENFEYLVEKGVDFHKFGNLALVLAAQNGQLEIVKFLIENGVDTRSDNNCALSMATEKEHAEVVDYLEYIKCINDNL